LKNIRKKTILKNKNLFIAGTRPEIVKISPLINRLNASILLTGQHHKKEMLNNFMDLVDTEEIYDLQLEEFRNFNNEIYKIVEILKNKIIEINPKNIFVLGDTNTTLVGAMAAKSAKKKLYFIESGLRSGDLEQIEEYNRIIVSHLADINFCNHQNNIVNLTDEGIHSNKISLTGSTVFSALSNLNLSFDGKGSEDYILLTLHRPENVDNSERLEDIVNSLKKINYKIIFPIHPRTNEKIKQNRNLNLNHLEILNPQDYMNFVRLIKNSKFLISDSGGLQEESMILRKPLLIPREYTERPEMLNKFNLLTFETEKMVDEAKLIIDGSSSLLKTTKTDSFLYGQSESIDNMLELI